MTYEKGSLHAFSYITITDISGKKVMRRVSHGRAHCVDLGTAKNMVALARGETEPGIANAGPFVHAEFKIAL